MALSYPYKQNDEDKEIPMLTFVDETMTPFHQLPPDDDAETEENNNNSNPDNGKQSDTE